MALEQIEKIVLQTIEPKSDGSFARKTAEWAGRPLTPSIIDVVAHFLLSQRSHNTRIAYARDILEFLDFCENIGGSPQDVAQLSEKLILRWKDHLTQKHTRFDHSQRRVANASVARKLCTLAAMLDFALKRKLITETPMAWVNRPKVRRQSHATVLNHEEIALILNTAKEELIHTRTQLTSSLSKKRQERENFRAETQWCILILLFTVGMRVSELCQLCLKDLTQEGDLFRLTFVAKGSRKHQPLIHPKASGVLTEFISRFRSEANADEPVFITRISDGKRQLPLHRSTIFRLVRSAARRAGIERAFSPHGCRATLATQLHKSGVPLVEIQTLLNHAQVTTTQLYLHRIDDLNEAAALQIPWTKSQTISED